LKKWLIIGGVVAAVVIIALIVLISLNDAWQTAAYVSVVILAIFMLFSTLLAIALLGALLYAVLAIRDIASNNLMPKVGQTLDQVKDSASAAKNTTTYVAESVVSPLIKLSSLAAGVKVAASALARRDRPRGYEPE
jgi:uncharacterized membrane protein